MRNKLSGRNAGMKVAKRVTVRSELKKKKIYGGQKILIKIKKINSALIDANKKYNLFEG